MREGSGRKLLFALLALGIVGVLAFVVARAQRLPEGPVEIVWDREACAHCKMHIGDPAFAAQLQTRDGRVLDFDDPGCLLRYEAEEHPEEHAVYFHELRGKRWLRRDQVGFVEVTPTPMGYGLGAVELGTPGAISPDEARARIERVVVEAGKAGKAVSP
jgi:hypothetical protein